MTDERLQDLVRGRLLGDLWPSVPLRPLPDIGAREYALRRLRQYISLLVFRRTEGPGLAPQAFRIPADKINIYQPDDVKDPPDLPGIAMLPGTMDHEYWGLGSPRPDEETIDKYAPGTVVVWLSDYYETFLLDIWSAKHAMRRAITEGLKVGLRLQEDTMALNLTLPDYFDQIATFNLIGGPGYLEDAEVAKNRRHAQIPIEVWVPEVVLVDYRRLKIRLDFGGPGARYIE